MQFIPPFQIRNICLRGDIDDDFINLVIPFMHGVQTTGPFGTVISQDFKGFDYAIYQHHFFIKRATFLYALPYKPILSINYMLRGTPVAKIPGIGDIPLPENTYTLFYVPPVPQEVWFEPGDYHCLHIVFDPQYLRKLAYRHEGLQRMLDYALKSSDMLLAHESGQIDGRVRILLKEAMVVREDAAETDIHFRSQVLQLFLQYIKRHHSIADTYLYKSDIERLVIIKDYIDNNLDKELAVTDLATQFGISPATLHRHFSGYFNQSVYNYFRERRMAYAMELVRSHSMSVNEISNELGYKNASSFTRAFTQNFGIPPAAFLRSQNPEDKI